MKLTLSEATRIGCIPLRTSSPPHCLENSLIPPYPITEPAASDPTAFDNVFKSLVVNGVTTLPEAIIMLVPEAWQGNGIMEPKKRCSTTGQPVFKSLGWSCPFHVTGEPTLIPTVFIRADMSQPTKISLFVPPWLEPFSSLPKTSG